jgi:2'-5' RNA ligase
VEKSDALSALRDRIESALVRGGLEPEHRKFTPHVTLARIKNGSAAEAAYFLETHAGFEAPAFTVEHFTLFESHLGHAGAQYTVLADYPLED